MARVAVKPELIRWAQERSGLSVEDLRSAFGRLVDWENGSAQPTLKQLEKFAKKTYTPLGYFFLEKPPQENLNLKDFRTLKGGTPRRPSPALLDTIHTMRRRQDWMREHLEEMGDDQLRFINSATSGDSPIETAHRMREQLGWTTEKSRSVANWAKALTNLCSSIEDSRIMVMFNGVVGNNTSRKLNVSEFRGFVLCDDFAPLIFVNNKDAKSAQMFTLAHELAHLWLGESGVFDLPELEPKNDDVERWCNRVAAEFLVPAAELLDFWPRVENIAKPFERIAKEFKVSQIVAARRVLDLKLISKPEFSEFYRLCISHEEKTSESSGGDFYRTQDKRLGRLFPEMVIQAARAGELLYRDAFNLTGLSSQTLDKFANHLGV